VQKATVKNARDRSPTRTRRIERGRRHRSLRKKGRSPHDTPKERAVMSNPIAYHHPLPRKRTMQPQGERKGGEENRQVTVLGKVLCTSLPSREQKRERIGGKNEVDASFREKASATTFLRRATHTILFGGGKKSAKRIREQK